MNWTTKQQSNEVGPALFLGSFAVKILRFGMAGGTRGAARNESSLGEHFHRRRAGCLRFVQQ